MTIIRALWINGISVIDLLVHADGSGNRTQYNYDSFGLLASVIYAPNVVAA